MATSDDTNEGATPGMATRRRTCLTLAAAGAMAGLAGRAGAWVGLSPVDLKVVDRETGRVLPVWRHDGRLFVAGRPGGRYGLRVSNHTEGRVLVVMSVDGVNVLTGETAGWDQRGYIFDPYETYDVNGWRKSDREVAAFTFAPLSQSYAARTGRPADVGVIGIAVFREKVEVPLEEPDVSADAPRRGYDDEAGLALQRKAPAAPAPAPPASIVAPSGRAAAAGQAAREPEDRLAEAGQAFRRDERLGTGHGAREWSVVQTVPFERATSNPEFTREIEYDTYAHLVALGVIPPRYPEGERRLRPFPSSPGGGYVPDPPDDP